MNWIAEATMPFSWALSKNRMWRRSGRGGYYMTEEARGWKTALALALRQNGKALGSLPGAASAKKPPKVWLDIMVVAADRRGDPLNLLDVCADGVQDGLGIDDRYFAIWRFDFVVLSKKGRKEGERPEIRVKVGL